MTDKTYDHSRKLTNQDYEPSNCFDCKRNEGGMCWLSGGVERYVAVTSKVATRCGYWYPRGDR